MAKRTVKAKAPAVKRAATTKRAVIDPFEAIAEDVSVGAEPAKPKRKTVSARSKTPRETTAKTEPPANRSAKTRSRKTATATSDPKPAGTRAAKRKTERAAKELPRDVTAEIAAAEPKVELSPVFKALAEPKLPELKRENRARLMMQSPTELYFYWSVKENPFHVLRDAFGPDTGSYTLVVKITELRSGIEEVHAVEPEGNWWFLVEPDGEYRAEIGFYAPNRPYFRILHSNIVETPRRAPSPHPAAESEWRLPAHKFAEVLDVAGFKQDALDVAMAGDDPVSADETAHAAFRQFIGTGGGRLRSVAAEEIRYTMVALAAGLKLDDIRWRVGPTLFAFLQANSDKLEAGNARNALSGHFDLDPAEFSDEAFGPAVHGASLVNFPRTLKPQKAAARYLPLSSHSIR